MDILRNQIGNGALDQRMKILALENSTTHGSVALLNDDAIVLDHQNDRKHSGAFFRSLQHLADGFRDLDTIVVGLGPGSYAGVRIAIASALGLRSATNAKLVGVPSICAIDPAPNEYAVIGDARRDSFFFARIVANQIVEGIVLYPEIELRCRLERPGQEFPIFSSEKLSQFPQAIVRYPSARMLGKLSDRGRVHSLSTPLEPIYLREPHITAPNDKRKISLLG
jgi:tRNA threonylcarbamoyladenosine biosynthesis protein TsaB